MSGYAQKMTYITEKDMKARKIGFMHQHQECVCVSITFSMWQGLNLSQLVMIL